MPCTAPSRMPRSPAAAAQVTAGFRVRCHHALILCISKAGIMNMTGKGERDIAREDRNGLCHSKERNV